MSNYIPKVHLAGVKCKRAGGSRAHFAARAEFLQLPVHRRCGFCNGSISGAPKAPYRPKGKILSLLAEVHADSSRIFSISEAARLMNVQPRAVMAMVAYALRAEQLFRGKDEAGITVLRGTPFHNVDPHVRPRRVTPQSRNPKKVAWAPRADDVRIPQVDPNWKPPRMVAPRGGSA